MDKILDLIKKEEKRQKETLLMIPSENYTYPEVREAVGSVLMHKYAEGLPGKRYYQGNTFVDSIEENCQREALKTFKLKAADWGVNVQSHSGTPANLAVYNALLSPGDKILSMFLPEGGHLSHGWHINENKVTLVSKIYNVDFYRIDPRTNQLNYEMIEKKALQFRPKLIISGGTAYPREINHSLLGIIAKKVSAIYMADVSHEAGLIAGGANISPFISADVVTMTTHKTLRGPRGAIIFARKKLMYEINKSVFPGIQGGPHLHSIAGIAIALEKAQSKEFSNYTKQVVINARRISDNLIKLGYDVVSGGTDKHLVLVDLRNKKINGWFAAWALEASGIIVNKNTVPSETNSAYYPSGIRLGTPAITARGMGEYEMDKISDWIDAVLRYLNKREVPTDKTIRDVYMKKFKEDVVKDQHYARIAVLVRKLCHAFPVPN